MASRFEDEPLPPGVPAVTYAPREPRLRRPPFLFIAFGIVAVIGSWVPLVLFARGRVTRSESPRLHLVQDMGSQPKYREQQKNEMFADGRADRQHIPGTVAHGTLQEDDHLYRGYKVTPAAGGAATKPTVTFIDGFPKQLKVDEEFLRRGEERFNIYCTACHGWDGAGNGPVRVTSRHIGQEWLIKSVHEPDVRARPDGHIFNTITNGIRTMPSYSAQISVEDRWRIVAYVRALQASQNPPPGAARAVAKATGDAKNANSPAASAGASAPRASR